MNPAFLAHGREKQQAYTTTAFRKRWPVIDEGFRKGVSQIAQEVAAECRIFAA
ncbi:MAG TPA: hypothetical protein VFW50_05410 [Streptosporangiaceae bacterium]|nr:hypothetical protein [Streptosporangiaceae bacterium]